MSTLYEGVGPFVEEENINGLVIRHYDSEALARGNGNQWLSEYIADTARLEVMHTHRDAVPFVEDEIDNVWLAWTARTIPGQLPYIVRNLNITQTSEHTPRNRRMPDISSQFERVQFGETKIIATFSQKAETEGQSEVVLSYPLGAPGVLYLAEMLIDRTAHQALLPHLPVILEREQDLLI